MKSWKLVILGGLAFYVATFVLSFATGPLIHNNVLKDSYVATEAMWRPELMQVPPDMGALMPYWVTTGLIGSFLLAWVYGTVRRSWSGPGWQKGMKGAMTIFVIWIAWALSYSGVFNLPAKIWIWWGVDTVILYLVGGAVLGAVAQKVAPE